MSNLRHRKFRIVAKTRENALITSFLLEPKEADGWQAFTAGQFLTLQIPASEAPGHVLRNYTVSSSPSQAGTYRITVKREHGNSGSVQVGKGSGWLHEVAQEGDELTIAGPAGNFRLDMASPKAVLLLSGGVGLTPLVSMLHVLAHESDRPVYFVHACEHGGVHALESEVRALAQVRPGIHVKYFYRHPTDDDRKTGAFHFEGMITRQSLQSFLPLDDYEVYLCGPTPFMEAMYATLKGLGVPENSISYEFFGPGGRLGVSGQPQLSTPAAPVTPLEPESAREGFAITLLKSNTSLVWDEAQESLLSFLEDKGFNPEFSCRAGICGSCKSRLAEGSVEYFEDPLDDVADGEVLLCCARPTGPIVLDL